MESFSTLDQAWLIKFLEHRIADETLGLRPQRGCEVLEAGSK